MGQLALQLRQRQQLNAAALSARQRGTQQPSQARALAGGQQLRSAPQAFRLRSRRAAAARGPAVPMRSFRQHSARLAELSQLLVPLTAPARCHKPGGCECGQGQQQAEQEGCQRRAAGAAALRVGRARCAVRAAAVLVGKHRRVRQAGGHGFEEHRPAHITAQGAQAAGGRSMSAMHGAMHSWIGAGRSAP